MSRTIGRRLGAVVFALALVFSRDAMAAKQKEPVKVTSAKKVKGMQRVVVGQFTVGFLNHVLVSRLASLR